MTILGMVQVPLAIPYDNVYNVPYFPVDNKKYPRFTLEVSAKPLFQLDSRTIGPALSKKLKKNCG